MAAMNLGQGNYGYTVGQGVADANQGLFAAMNNPANKGTTVGGAIGGTTNQDLLKTINAPSPAPIPTPKLPDYQQPTYKQPDLLNPQQGSVISPELLNSQINAAQATNNRATGTQQQQQLGSLAGRGVGVHSPLAAAIQAQLQGANIGANAQSSLQAQNNAAMLNANYAQGMNQALLGNAANVYGSQVAGGAQAYGAGIGGLTSLYGTQAGAQTSQLNALRQAAANAYGSNLGYQGQVESSLLGLEGSRYSSDASKSAAIAAANIQAQASKQNAIVNALASFAS